MEQSKIFILEETIQLGIRGLTRMENIILGLIMVWMQINLNSAM